MRGAVTEKVERGRLQFGRLSSPKGVIYGAFEVAGPCGRLLTIISSDGDKDIPWEHVSVSLTGRHPPNWEEMCWVKDQFWTDEETVVQFHPKKSEYKNLHPNCLHLWRHVSTIHELPPRLAV